MFVVFLDSQEVHAPVGVHEFERKAGVKLHISVRVALREKPDLDHIEQTLDYTQLVDIVNQQSARERLLLETLAHDIHAAILDKSLIPIDKIHIRIEKPLIPHEGYKANSCGIEFSYSIK